MLKLLIADDERIIRETISSLIDWNALDVELIGLCSNGLEAYDMIIDESPDIVMTDIKMPGMNGLELIRNISETNLDTQFIILSGYGEFEYAKEAMKYGVKHYILKPCDEEQISESILAVIEDCHKRRREQVQKNGDPLFTSSMHYNIVSAVISECATHGRTLEEMLKVYRIYMDFSSVSYHLIYVYYLEYENLEAWLKQLQSYYDAHMPQIALHGVYITNTLLLFFQNYAEDYSRLYHALGAISIPGSRTETVIEGQHYSCLEQLLDEIIIKLKRFSSLYYINHFHLVYTCNHNSFSEEVLQAFRNILDKKDGNTQDLERLLQSIDDIHFLKQLAGSLLLEGNLRYTENFDAESSSQELADWLTESSQCTSPDQLRGLLTRYVQKLMDTRKPSTHIMVEQICSYVEQHLSDSNITLKEIAENCLYMNVDYVSRRFLKETGRKFSDYLAEVRIRRAKQYLAEGCRIQDVAEKVGCGNNPHYFSQLFKKKTGTTPSAYAAKYH